MKLSGSKWSFLFYLPESNSQRVDLHLKSWMVGIPEGQEPVAVPHMRQPVVGCTQIFRGCDETGKNHPKMKRTIMLQKLHFFFFVGVLSFEVPCSILLVELSSNDDLSSTYPVEFL